MMLAEALREGITRLAGSFLLSEDRVVAVIRETLGRYGVEEREIDKAVEEARANLSRWRAATGAGGPSASVAAFGEAALAGMRGLLGALGIPTRDDLDALARRIEQALATRGDPTPSPPAPGAAPAGRAGRRRPMGREKTGKEA